MPNPEEQDQGKPDPNIDGLKQSIEHIIGAKTKLKRRKKTPLDLEKEDFIKLISSIENVFARSCLTPEIMIDLSKYDENFYEIIDQLLELHYGKTIKDVINFYLYDRMEDGKVKALHDENKNEIPLENLNDLYNLVKRLSVESDKKKNVSSKKKK